jgi:tetratricopeptide (TPR) repeat protein
LAGIWDEGRKRDVSAAFMATGKPYAADTVRLVERALDAYAHDWVAMHTDACEATRLRGEQSEEVLDLRMECLSDRRQELQSLVDILARRDPTVVEKAAQATGGLTALKGCANIAALRAPMRPPGDPTTRAKAEELRTKLAQASALEAAAKYSEALPIAKTAAAEATQLRYRPIEAEALLRLASLQARIGDFKNADQTLRNAGLAAVGGRHDEALARSWIYLIGVAKELRQYEQGHEAARYASALLERLGGVDELRGRLFNNLGSLLESEGKYAEALDHHQRALELWERSLGAENADVAGSLNNAAIALRQLGQYDRAIDNYQRALAIREKAVGPDHPLMVGPLLNLGSVFAAQGKYELALTYTQRALALSEKVFGPQHPWVATALGNAGSVFSSQGKYDQAVAYHRRALAIAEKAFGPDHHEVAKILNNLGRAFYGEDDLASALEHFRRALAIQERVPDEAENPDTATTLLNLALALSEQQKRGNFDIAVSYLHRALAIREKTSGPESPDAAYVLAALGRIVHEKEPKRALEYLQRALDIREKRLPANSPMIAVTRTELGRVYLYQRQPMEARHQLEMASQLLESSPADPMYLASTQFLLARALWDGHSDRERAIDLAQQARASMVKAGRAKSKTFRELDAWLSARLKLQASAPRAL